MVVVVVVVEFLSKQLLNFQMTKYTKKKEEATSYILL